MEPWHWAVLLKPLALIFFVGAVVYPIRWACRRYVPEGRFKRILFDERVGTWYAYVWWGLCGLFLTAGILGEILKFIG